jgi:hypothetical protein
LSELLFSTTEQRTDFTLNCDVASELPMVVAFDLRPARHYVNHGNSAAILLEAARRTGAAMTAVYALPGLLSPM